jgi:hypothetical protein
MIRIVEAQVQTIVGGDSHNSFGRELKFWLWVEVLG